MRRRLLEVLADPDTGEPLAIEGDDGRDEVDEGFLVSPSGRRFPIIGGIPRFVPRDTYAASFGLQWNRFARVQLDSHTGRTYSRDRFLDETGWTSADVGGQWVVDAGCGSGRFAEIAAGLGAEVLAVDLSSAVDATAQNLRELPNVHVVQADLRRLPIRTGAVSWLYSIGVLQHTDDPLGAAGDLVARLSEGGRFTFTVYARQPWTKLYSKYLVRPLSRRLPPRLLLRLVEGSMPVVFPVTSFLFSLPVVGRVFSFLIPVANYVERTDMPREIRYEEAILDTFDMLAPRYDQPITADELASAIGTSATLEFHRRVPVVARGERASR